MNAVLKSAEADRHIFIDLYDDNLGSLAAGCHMGSIWSEVEITVLVHRSDLEYSYIRFGCGLTIVSRKLGITDRSIEAESLCDCLSLDTAHVPGVPGHMSCRVFDLEDLRYPHQDTAAEVYILQFRKTFCDSSIDCYRSASGPAIVNPVARFNDGSSFFSGNQLFCIQFLVIHTYSPCPF